MCAHAHTDTCTRTALAYTHMLSHTHSIDEAVEWECCKESHGRPGSPTSAAGGEAGGEGVLPPPSPHRNSRNGASFELDELLRDMIVRDESGDGAGGANGGLASAFPPSQSVEDGDRGANVRGHV